MLRVFTYCDEPLPVHNERFTYIPVEYVSEIESAVKKKPPRFSTTVDLPLYLPKYAVVYPGFIELRSTLTPGPFVTVDPHELPMAVYQYFHVEPPPPFYVCYSEDSDMGLIKDRLECRTCVPEFKKVDCGDHATAVSCVFDAWSRDGRSVNPTFYFVDSSTGEIKMGSVLSGCARCSVTVERITPPHLSEYATMKLLTSESHAKRNGNGGVYNVMFDDGVVLLEEYK